MTELRKMNSVHGGAIHKRGLTFVSEHGHRYGEQGTQHVEQGYSCSQRPVILTLGALCTLLDSCKTRR